MLVITRRIGEKIFIDGDITIEVLEVLSYKRIKLGITAPKEVSIVREENYEFRKGIEDDDFDID